MSTPHRLTDVPFLKKIRREKLGKGLGGGINKTLLLGCFKTILLTFCLIYDIILAGHVILVTYFGCTQKVFDNEHYYDTAS